MTDTPLKRAIEIAGGQSGLARKLGVRQSHIWHWLERSKRGVPAEWCLAIERETGVLASELRPDIFPHSPDQPLLIASVSEDVSVKRRDHEKSAARLSQRAAR